MLSRRPLLAGLAGSALAPVLLAPAALVPVALAPVLASGPAFGAEPGVEATRIRFGQAVPLEGPAAQLGLGMRDGIAAAFAEANRGGGIRGHQLDLISRDDGYEPTQSVEVTQKLIKEDQVFALIGPVGTPTSQAAQPVAAEAGVPFIGPFTGAQFLRAAALANVINLRASYFQETEVMVERLVKDLNAQKIAILYQDDAYGRAGLDGVGRALAKRSMTLVAEATYERNTTAVRAAVLTIQKAKPDAVIMIGAYKPCAEFIKVARQLRMAATFVNISFVGSDALAEELGVAGSGVVITQVVPFPRDTGNPLVARYQAALHAQNAEARPGFVSLEGYLVGRLAIAALGMMEGAPTREGLLRTLRANKFDIDGFPLTFGPDRNFGSDAVYLTVIDPAGNLQPVDSLSATKG